LIARSMFSFGMDAAFAASIAVRSRGLCAGSPPASFAAIVISRMSFVKLGAALGVGRRLVMLDLLPLAMAGHIQLG